MQNASGINIELGLLSVFKFDLKNKDEELTSHLALKAPFLRLWITLWKTGSTVYSFCRITSKT